jgi:hypothetical protein
MNENKSEELRVVNLYLTPFAVILILFAVFFSRPTGFPLYASILLVAAGLLNNIVARVNTSVRMTVNVLINVFLVYFLVGYWGPIWYLFLTTPVALAVYSDRLKTFLAGLLMSFLLLGIYAIKGLASAQAWGQALCRVVLIIFLSLFINALVSKRVEIQRSNSDI